MMRKLWGNDEEMMGTLWQNLEEIMGKMMGKCSESW